METLELKNVIGSEKTATVITREMLSPLLSLNLPIGQRFPSNWLPPEGYTLEKATVNNVPLERLKPELGYNGKVILMLHGGAYVWPLLDNNRELAVIFSQLAKGAEVVNVDYRVAPTHPYPAAFEDCVAAYKALLGFGYTSENILLMGESAGGGLVLSVALYLKEHQLPLPKGIISLSPSAEIHNLAPSHRINYSKDLILGENGCPLSDQIQKQDYRGTTDYKTPYLSPIYGDYTNFPDLLIQAGTYEMLYDDSRRVAEKAEKAGCHVTFSSYYGMCHCFQEILPDIPESKAAWTQIQQFINQCFNLQ